MTSFTIGQSFSLFLTGFKFMKFLNNFISKLFLITSHSLFSPKISYIFCNKYLPNANESHVFLISVTSGWVILFKV